MFWRSGIAWRGGEEEATAAEVAAADPELEDGGEGCRGRGVYCSADKLVPGEGSDEEPCERGSAFVPAGGGEAGKYGFAEAEDEEDGEDQECGIEERCMLMAGDGVMPTGRVGRPSSTSASSSSCTGIRTGPGPLRRRLGS